MLNNGKVDNDVENNDLSKGMTVESKPIDNSTPAPAVKYLSPSASKRYSNIMSNTTGFILEERYKDSSPK